MSTDLGRYISAELDSIRTLGYSRSDLGAFVSKAHAAQTAQLKAKKGPVKVTDIIIPLGPLGYSINLVNEHCNGHSKTLAVSLLDEQGSREVSYIYVAEHGNGLLFEDNVVYLFVTAEKAIRKIVMKAYGRSQHPH